MFWIAFGSDVVRIDGAGGGFTTRASTFGVANSAVLDCWKPMVTLVGPDAVGVVRGERVAGLARREAVAADVVRAQRRDLAVAGRLLLDVGLVGLRGRGVHGERVAAVRDGAAEEAAHEERLGQRLVREAQDVELAPLPAAHPPPEARPDVVESNVRTILAALRDHDPKMPVVLCQVFPSSATKKRPAAVIKETNARLLALARNDPRVTIVDTWRLWADAAGDAPVAERAPPLRHHRGDGLELGILRANGLHADDGVGFAEPDQRAAHPVAPILE